MRNQVANLLKQWPWIALAGQAIYRIGRPKFSVGVVGILFDSEQRVLLVEHVFHPKTPWGLPGGWVERKEALDISLQREMQEELELSVEVGPVVAVEIPPRRPYHVDIAYLCFTDGVVGQISAELLSHRWTDVHTLPHIPRFHRRAIEAAFQYQSQVKR